mgnify:CR=1 FL=1
MFRMPLDVAMGTVLIVLLLEATRRAMEAVFEHRIRILPVDGQWVVVPRSA